MTILRCIGYWRSEREPDLPDVVALVSDQPLDDSWKDIADHLKHGMPTRLWMGASTCRICGCANGFADLTDGTYEWPEGLAHYVEAHGVRLPSEFVVHFEQATRDHNEAERDRDWWRSQTGL